MLIFSVLLSEILKIKCLKLTFLTICHVNTDKIS